MAEDLRTDDGELLRLVYVADSAIHGKGLFAVSGIGAGIYIGTFDGEDTQRDGDHVLWVHDPRTDAWIGRRGTNLLRFVNHAARANAAFDGFDLYALTAIGADDEITIDYGGVE